ncbi:cytidylyltransferase domain-containing protein [Aerococcus urinaeequi]|uniref:cytidylyltransferase domain-containing protein n=2 Tax=Aerococcus urinaeequi TaxID=51665 RepID=UPI0022E588E5|nr:glycosyltransferase [Aerococcus urinaeequi]
MMNPSVNILAIIPARGGSKGIPRKNVLLLSGQPLISYAIQNAKSSRFQMDVAVSTDDQEITNVSNQFGAEVIRRNKKLASDEVTLDPVIFDAVQQMEGKTGKTYDYVITLQPTSPLLSADTLDSAIQKMLNDETIDTLISAVNDPHLSWTTKEVKGVVTVLPNYEARLNRQYLPKNFVETGAFVITKRHFVKPDTRFGKNISVYEVPASESTDIDTKQDWWVAEKQLSKKNILIRVEGYSEIGLGHVYRGLSLAYSLMDHNVTFVTSSKSDLAIKKLEDSFIKYEVIQEEHQLEEIIAKYDVDIVINDILNTSISYMEYLSQFSVRVVNFEDVGPGSALADAVINDLYAPQNTDSKYYWGSKYYLLRDEFLISKPSEFNEEVNNVFVIFGGVDPSNLTQKVLDAFEQINTNEDVEFTVVVGPGYAEFEKIQDIAENSALNISVFKDVNNMAEMMKRSDIAISSQGRTMLELASMNVPTILMAQNERELTHEFGYLSNGFINLGLGEAIDSSSIALTLEWLMNTPQIRRQMHNQMQKKDLRNGFKRVKSIILGDE